MSHVLIARAHRADAEADVSRWGLSGHTTVIDVEPTLDDRPASLASEGVKNQCAGCNYATFLEHRTDLSGFIGLDPQRRFFAAIPGLLDAVDRRSTEALLAAVRRTNAHAIREVLGPGDVPTLGVPVLQTVTSRASVAPPRSAEDVALVEPGGEGVEAVLSDILAASRAGFRRVYLGHARHARAMEGFTAFLEREHFREEWAALLAGAYATGIDKLGLMLAFPPCASLQWAANRPLEQLRARLDLHFRRMDDTASAMCPENVSGYAMHNDTRSFVEEFAPRARTLALRLDRIILSFRVGADDAQH